MTHLKVPGPFVRQFLIDGQWLGESPCSMAVIHDRPSPPMSLTMVCPHCAEIWARFPVGLPEGKPHWFQVISAPCRKCHQPDDIWKVGGSISPWSLLLPGEFPEAVWKRELEIHLSLYPQHQPEHEEAIA